MGNSWDGTERRGSKEWLEDRQKVLSDIQDTKEDVKGIKDDVMEIKLSLAELKTEIKHIVGKSATTTSTWVSMAVSVISGVIIYYITGVKG